MADGAEAANGGRIMIVSGLPRSGTSMMMRMLEAGGLPVLSDNLRRADQDNPRGYYEFEPVKAIQRDTSWLVDARGKVVKVVSMLLYHLPPEYPYTIVFMQRDLGEILASQNAMLRRSGKDEAARPSGEVMALKFREHLDRLEAWLAKQDNIVVFHVSYNEVLADPDRLIAALNTFIGGRLNEERAAGAVEPGLHHQRFASSTTTGRARRGHKPRD